MVIATFGPTTALAGKTITFESGQYVLEGTGPITARAVLEYDRQGHLTWAYDGLREWVQQAASGGQPAGRAQRSARQGEPSVKRGATAKGQPGRLREAWSRLSGGQQVGCLAMVVVVVLFIVVMSIWGDELDSGDAGGPIYPEQVSQVEEGMSRADVEAIFGGASGATEPINSQIWNEKGDPNGPYEYRFWGEGNLWIAVGFDDSGRVQKVYRGWSYPEQ